MPSEASMPEPDLKALHDQLTSQIQNLKAQHVDMCKYRNNLSQKIEELEKMIEALSAGINSAAQYFPQPAEPQPEPAHNYARGLGS